MFCRFLEPRVNIPRPAALRGVAGNIFEFTFLFAARTGIRSYRGGEQKSTVAALPVRKPASRTNIAGKISRQIYAAIFTRLCITHGIILHIRVNWNSLLRLIAQKNSYVNSDNLNPAGSSEQQKNY